MSLLFWITTHSLNRPPIPSQTFLRFITGLPFTPKDCSVLQQTSQSLPNIPPFYNRPPIHSQILLHFTTVLPFTPQYFSILLQVQSILTAAWTVRWCGTQLLWHRKMAPSSFMSVEAPNSSSNVVQRLVCRIKISKVLGHLL